MAFELVPIHVKIGLRSNGHADHPNFNALPPSVRGSMDWSHYIDRFGSGWLYDSVCGHKDSDAANPEVAADDPHRNEEVGVHYGCVLVPEAFAEAAVAKYPTLVRIIDEVEMEQFYDNRHAKKQPEILEDTEVLQAIKERKSMAAEHPLSAKEAKQHEDALNPDVQSERGVRKNLNRYWADYKAKRGISIRAKERKPE